jgi:hypothetical protein
MFLAEFEGFSLPSIEHMFKVMCNAELLAKPGVTFEHKL